MAIAPDDSVWLIGWEGEDDDTFLERSADAHLHVITPEAVAATR